MLGYYLLAINIYIYIIFFFSLLGANSKQILGPTHFALFHLYLYMVRFSILINWSPCGFFENYRGLRQRDPLSPSLFVIVIDAISRMLDQAMKEGRFLGFIVHNSVGNTLMASHHLFANNIMIFCGADMDQLLIIHLVFI